MEASPRDRVAPWGWKTRRGYGACELACRAPLQRPGNSIGPSLRNASWGEGRVSCYYFGSQLNGVGGGFFYHCEMSALTIHFTGWAIFSATGFLS
mgnify:CR=1 FL=1